MWPALPALRIYPLCLNSRLFGTFNQNGPIPSAKSIPIQEVSCSHLIFMVAVSADRGKKERGIRVCTRTQDHKGEAEG